MAKLGLKGPQATQLRSYSHFRTPVTAKKKSLLQKEGLSATLDFLDTLDEDIPKGISFPVLFFIFLYFFHLLMLLSLCVHLVNFSCSSSLFT